MIDQNLRHRAVLLQTQIRFQKLFRPHQIPRCRGGCMDAVKMLHQIIIILKLRQNRHISFAGSTAFLSVLYFCQRRTACPIQSHLGSGCRTGWPIPVSRSHGACIFHPGSGTLIPKKVHVCVIRIPVVLINSIGGISSPVAYRLLLRHNRRITASQQHSQSLKQPLHQLTQAGQSPFSAVS